MHAVIARIQRKLQQGSTIVACCCGHRRYRRTVIIHNAAGLNYEYYSNKTIPRKRKFYKLDKQGYYYIPEIDMPK